tara:strand:- start:2120 stop:2581 length:462 start_codon:yes stop_codon:yes gene_type:complete
MKKFLILSFIFISCQNISDEIIVDTDVEDMYLRYNKAWSEGDFETITNEIYSAPFSLYLQDSTIILNSPEEIKNFLIITFDELEMNNYGYSIRNSWESYKLDDNLVIVEQNFTRFLKDSTIMGPAERTASYILRKSNGKFQITGMVPHTTIAK